VKPTEIILQIDFDAEKTKNRIAEFRNLEIPEDARSYQIFVGYYRLENQCSSSLSWLLMKTGKVFD
jgi:hypothetical protein